MNKGYIKGALKLDFLAKDAEKKLTNWIPAQQVI